MADAVLDQAAGLRQLLAPRSRAIVCILAGDRAAASPGLTRNLALEIASRGRSVRLIDCVCADDLPNGEERAGAKVPAGIGTPGLRTIQARHLGLTFGAGEGGDAAALARALAALRGPAELAIVHAPAASVAFSVAADEVVLLTRSDPAAILDSYRLLKRMTGLRERRRAHVLVAGAQSSVRAGRIFGNLSGAARQFLALPLEYLGEVPEAGHAPAFIRACADGILRCF